MKGLALDTLLVFIILLSIAGALIHHSPPGLYQCVEGYTYGKDMR